MHLSEISEELIRLALREDIGSGDITTNALIDPALQAGANLLVKEECIICGLEVARSVFRQVDSSITFELRAKDGDRLTPGTIAASVKGSFAAILQAERTALNFLQRMSGIATKTATVAAHLKGLSTKLLDTRKTTPGWRELEKYSVQIGGGKNHRTGLFDQILIKNNHIDALGGDITAALRKARAAARGFVVEVEVRNEAELREAINESPDIILLDNMSPEELKRCVTIIKQSGRTIQTEASGGITEANVRAVAESGVDFVSMGALTHSVRSIDISLRYV